VGCGSEPGAAETVATQPSRWLPGSPLSARDEHFRRHADFPALLGEQGSADIHSGIGGAAAVSVSQLATSATLAKRWSAPAVRLTLIAAHNYELCAGVLREARARLDDLFGAEMTGDAWVVIASVKVSWPPGSSAISATVGS